MKKILVVDDNFHNRNLINLIFELEPFELLMAENGEQALALAKAQKPDIILLDILLPGTLNGFTVCQQLRNDPQTKDLYVIMVTAKSQALDLLAGYDAGADDYIVKPYSPVELKERVMSVLEARSVS